MDDLSVGFLGFGKAACIFIEDLKSAGLKKIAAYDKYGNVEPYSTVIREASEKLSVNLVFSPLELAVQTIMVLSMVTPASAEEAAISIAPYLPDNSFFVDLNSSSPMTKQRCFNYINRVNPSVKYLDGCILGAVSENRLRTPILLCGQGANQAKEYLDRFGANVEIIEGTPGDASAVKMIRSVFMKGIEVLLIEALHGARAYNIQNQFIRTIKDTFETLTFDQLVNMLVTTHAIHGRRRQGEMKEVIDTLKAKNIDARMSESILEKFRWSSELALADYFQHRLPEEHESVIEALYAKAKVSY